MKFRQIFNMNKIAGTTRRALYRYVCLIFHQNKINENCLETRYYQFRYLLIYFTKTLIVVANCFGEKIREN